MSIWENFEVKSFELCPGLVVAYSGYPLNMDPRFGSVEEVAHNRSQLAAAIGATQKTYVVKPEVADGLIYLPNDSDPRVETDQKGILREVNVAADTLVTDKINTGLMLNPADCIGLILGSRMSNAFAIVHLGWRQILDRLHLQAVDSLREVHGILPSQLLAWLSPSIGPDSYIASKLQPVQETEEWQPYVVKRGSVYHLNFPGKVAGDLRKCGVVPESIHVDSTDVAVPENGYYSFVRHKSNPEIYPNGRNGILVARTHKVSVR